MHEMNVQIDRIILDGLDVELEHVGSINRLVKTELQRLLEQKPFTAGVDSGEVPHLVAPTIHLDEATSNHHLANSLAQSIVRSLHSMTSQKQRE